VSNIFKPDRIMPLGQSLIDPRYQSLWDDLLVLAPIWLGGGAVAQNLADRTSEGTIVDTANTVWRHGRRGRVLEQLAAHTSAADADAINILPDAELPTTAATVLLHQRKTDTTNRQSAAFGNADTALTNRCGGHVPWSNGSVFWDFAGAVDGITRLTAPGLTFGDDVWVFVVGSRGMEIWQNGTLVGSHGNSVTRIAASSNWGLGHHGGVGNDLVEYGFLALWGRELSHSEIRLASNNPFGMITPADDDLGFVAAVGEVEVVVLTAFQLSAPELGGVGLASPVFANVVLTAPGLGNTSVE